MEDFQDLQLLRAEDVARILKVAKVTPYAWARKNKIAYYRIEGVIRFKPEDLKAFIEARRVERKK
jgi:excisionase family DNA binding protein